MTNQKYDEPYHATHWEPHPWMMIVQRDSIAPILIGGIPAIEIGADYVFRLTKISSDGAAYFKLARVRPWWKRLLRIGA